MKKEAKILFGKSLDSLTLAISIFNSPWDCGREEAVLVLLDRAFELFLKAAIVHKGGRIREPRAKETIGFDKCVRKCLSEEKVKCLEDEEALALQMINSLRDAAQHYIVDISEQQLYLHAQAGLTLYRQLLKRVFDLDLRDHFPERALPVSVSPPTSLEGLMDAEFAEIKKLVKPGKRQRLQARAKMRSVAIMEASLAGERVQPSEAQLGKLLNRVGEGKSWKDLFPGVASLRLDVSDSAYGVAIRITKSEGDAVHLVPEGTPGATTLAVKRVNELDYYSLGAQQLAEKCKLTMPKANALIWYLKLQDSDDYFKEIRIGSQRYKRYSPKALHELRQAMEELEIDDVWQTYREAR